MIGFSERQFAADMRQRLHDMTAEHDSTCDECDGDGKIGILVVDDRPEAECPCCYGSGEHNAVAYDVYHNGPRDAR